MSRTGLVHVGQPTFKMEGVIKRSLGMLMYLQNRILLFCCSFLRIKKLEKPKGKLSVQLFFNAGTGMSGLKYFKDIILCTCDVEADIKLVIVIYPIHAIYPSTSENF